jgi:hypothetical protein
MEDPRFLKARTVSVFLGVLPSPGTVSIPLSIAWLLVLIAAIHQVAGLALNSGLLGSDLKDLALIDQWIHLAESEIADNASLIWRLTTRQLMPFGKTVSFQSLSAPCLIH